MGITMFDLISFAFPMVIGAGILALGYFLGRIDFEPRKDVPTPGPEPKAKEDEPKPKPYDSW